MAAWFHFCATFIVQRCNGTLTHSNREAKSGLGRRLRFFMKVQEFRSALVHGGTDAKNSISDLLTIPYRYHIRIGRHCGGLCWWAWYDHIRNFCISVFGNLCWE